MYKLVICSVLALTLSVQAVAQEAGKKFDLICGQQKSKQKTHFRIDLENSRWCVDSCSNVLDIFEIGERYIYLVKSEAKFEADEEDIKRIDRVTGEYFYVYKNPPVDIFEVRTEPCVVAEFSGFLAVKRLF